MPGRRMREAMYSQRRLRAAGGDSRMRPRRVRTLRDLIVQGVIEPGKELIRDVVRRGSPGEPSAPTLPRLRLRRRSGDDDVPREDLRQRMGEQDIEEMVDQLMVPLLRPDRGVPWSPPCRTNHPPTPSSAPCAPRPERRSSPASTRWGGAPGPAPSPSARRSPDCGGRPRASPTPSCSAVKRRTAIAEVLGTWVTSYALGHASSEEIDDLGMTAALRLAAVRALEALPGPAGRGDPRRQARLPRRRPGRSVR